MPCKLGNRAFISEYDFSYGKETVLTCHSQTKKNPFYIKKNYLPPWKQVGDQVSEFVNLQSNWNNMADYGGYKNTHICVSYSLGYLKHLNKYALTTNVLNV